MFPDIPRACVAHIEKQNQHYEQLSTLWTVFLTLIGDLNFVFESLGNFQSSQKLSRSYEHEKDKPKFVKVNTNNPDAILAFKNEVKN